MNDWGQPPHHHQLPTNPAWNDDANGGGGVGGVGGVPLFVAAGEAEAEVPPLEAAALLELSPQPPPTAAAAGAAAAEAGEEESLEEEEEDDDYEDEEEEEEPPAEEPPRKKARKKGDHTGKRECRSNDFWYRLCHLKATRYPDMKQSVFVRTKTELEGTRSQVESFRGRMGMYRSGKLKPGLNTRKNRTTKYPVVERKVALYAMAVTRMRRGRSGNGDAVGGGEGAGGGGGGPLRRRSPLLTWRRLHQKARRYAREEGIADFKVAACWLPRIMERYGLALDPSKPKGGGCSSKKSGNDKEEQEAEATAEAADDDVEAEAVSRWRQESLFPAIEELDVPAERVYEGTTSRLFYGRLPCAERDDDDDKSPEGSRAQRGNNFGERVAVMACTSATGRRCPLAVVGKPKNPECFRYCCEGGTPPLPYRSQRHAEFDGEATAWWINDVFWPWHARENGDDEEAVLLLDNTKTNAELLSDDARLLLPEKLKVILYPAEMRSSRKPAGFGLIAGLKVCYKSLLLRGLLGVFELPGGYEEAARRRARLPPGCRGIEFGGKPTLLDAISMLETVWSSDYKYASEWSIRRYWRGAGILPEEWKLKVNFGKTPAAEKGKALSKEDTTLLCGLLETLFAKANEAGVDFTSDVASCLRGSFVAESKVTRRAMRDMADRWVSFEEAEIADDIIADEDAEEQIRKERRAMEKQQQGDGGQQMERDEDEDEREKSREVDDRATAEDAGDGAAAAPSIASLSQAEDALDELRKYADAANMPDEVKKHLLRLSRAFRQHELHQLSSYGFQFGKICSD